MYRPARRHSKESPTPQQGTGDATARNARRYSKERPTPREGFPEATCGGRKNPA
ncbi:MAG: hypothetical protein IJT11_07270 [Bacteroidaceae bacterium]|nr:hypothetical protein [Bacteroidaceae bacterium]